MPLNRRDFLKGLGLLLSTLPFSKFQKPLTVETEDLPEPEPMTAQEDYSEQLTVESLDLGPWIMVGDWSGGGPLRVNTWTVTSLGFKPDVRMFLDYQVAPTRGWPYLTYHMESPNRSET